MARRNATAGRTANELHGRRRHTCRCCAPFAALLVVFVHLDELLPRLGLPLFGGAGVDIFFVISGFIMVHTTMDRDDVTPWSFMAGRISRIVPAYWVATFAVFGIALVAPSLLRTPHLPVGELLQSLAFIPFVKDSGLTQPLLFVGWTLNYERFFYLVFAMGLGSSPRRISPCRHRPD